MYNMKTKHWLMTVAFIMAFTFIWPNFSSAEQPESSYWYPEELLNWSPDKDSDAEFNRSRVPLAKREELYKVNDNAQSKSKLVALAALNSNTSGVPSQGDDEYFVNTFSNWQYVDLMVYWAGSSDEGIIVPPSADVIDAAHKNGVPITGNIFFPPEEYGGEFDWVNEMLTQRSDGSFPAADKLLEVADYYGFDGWFINQETSGGDEKTAKKMQDFMKYLQNHKSDNMEIIWYDSMTKDGEIDWQNALTDNNSDFLIDDGETVADSMFLNFWWDDQQSSFDKAQEIGVDPYRLFAGIDVEQDGTDTDISWDGIFPDNADPLASLGIYRPDWTFETSENMKEFNQKEIEFWTAPSGNPSETDDNDDWKGMSHYFTAKTAVQDLPFVTHFNTGSGKSFSVDGNVVSEQSWNNRSVQDILPTWRWLIEGDQSINVDFDSEDAYYGGNSLKISGDMDTDDSSHIKFYKTNLPIQEDTEISLTYKTNSKDPNLKLGISFIDDPDEFVYLDLKNQEKNEWVTDSFELDKYSDKKIGAISLFVDSDENVDEFTANIGEMKVYNSEEQEDHVDPPKNGKASDVELNENQYADVNLAWDSSDSDISHYEIYRKLSDDKKEFVGGTPNDVYHISSLKQNDEEAITDLEIVAVNKEHERSKPIEVSFSWDDDVELNDVRQLIKELDKTGEIDTKNTAEQMLEHITIAENQDEKGEVIQHMKHFEEVIDVLLNNGHLSEEAYQELSQLTKQIIVKYQNES